MALGKQRAMNEKHTILLASGYNKPKTVERLGSQQIA